MKVVVFSYNREEMLRKVVALLVSCDMDYHVLDDGSDFDLAAFIPRDRFTRFKHGGKQSFWKKFAYAFDLCKRSEHNTFAFIQDDLMDVDYKTMQEIGSQWVNKLYCMHLCNDGREYCWGRFRMGVKPIHYGANTLVEVGFCDCIFMTNRKTLEDLTIDPVPSVWFDRPDKSSGVGAQLTEKLRISGVPMVKPLKSLCYHGDHPSTMHGAHRKVMPLITK